MSARAFSEYNVTAWLLMKGTSPEYVIKHNRTIKATMKQLEESGSYDRDNPARMGIHSEVFVADELSRRLDVLRGETVVKQIFTERIPCKECRKLLSNIPRLMDVPRYFYLTYHDKEWQRERADGKWGVFLMNCYRLQS